LFASTKKRIGKNVASGLDRQFTTLTGFLGCRVLSLVQRII
jgi:hypothetical protein